MDLLQQLFDTDLWPRRWDCGRWSELLGWTHVLGDAAIFGAYVAIPLVLALFLRRRPDLPFVPVMWLFAAFVLSCGVAHLVEATIFWHPWYRLSALMKVATALVSWATVIALFGVVPQALRLPGLAAVNARLEQEIAARREAESRLAEQAARLLRENDELERFTLAIGSREERVLALKQEVNALLEEAGRPPRYRSAPEGEAG